MLVKLTPIVDFANILFLIQFPFTIKLQSQTVSREELLQTLSCKKKLLVYVSEIDTLSEIIVLSVKMRIRELGPCTPNSNLNFRVRIRVGNFFLRN